MSCEDRLMANGKRETIESILGFHFSAHPWHGVAAGEEAPRLVNAYIEIVPTDAVKYELDKVSGHLRIDRPQRFSSMCPALYGFIPRTLCGEEVARGCSAHIGSAEIQGDGDPMDICVLTERPVAHGDIFVQAKPIGGFRMIDGAQADDKIIAVLDSDSVYGEIKTIADCPPHLIERLKHYFLSYKQPPNGNATSVEIVDVYDCDEAHQIIEQSMRDYKNAFQKQNQQLTRLLETLRTSVE